MKENIVEKLKPVIEEIVNSQSLHLYSLEYLKEDGHYFLRVSIEKQDGSMDFETAEVVSNLISSKLDELDPIDHEYILDVCSPGIERPLEGKDEFIEHVNDYVTIIDKNDVSYTGDLIEANDENITIKCNIKGRIKKIFIKYEEIKQANLAVKF